MSSSPFPKNENKEIISFCFKIKVRFYRISGLQRMSVSKSYITYRHLIEDINFQALDADI